MQDQAWASGHIKDKKEIEEIMQVPKEPMNEGMNNFQGRIYKVIQGLDFENSGMGFDAAGWRAIGLGDLEELSRTKHRYEPNIMWNAIRATKDNKLGESSYMVLMDEEGQEEGKVAVYVLCRHNRTKANYQYGGSQGSGYQHGGYKRKNY